MSGEGGQNGLRLLIAQHGAVNVVNQQIQVILKASLHKIAIYGPMICTAPYVMLLMRANLLRGQEGEGWALEL